MPYYFKPQCAGSFSLSYRCIIGLSAQIEHVCEFAVCAAPRLVFRVDLWRLKDRWKAEMAEAFKSMLR
jgi:hypothetical protein